MNTDYVSLALSMRREWSTRGFYLLGRLLTNSSTWEYFGVWTIRPAGSVRRTPTTGSFIRATRRDIQPPSPRRFWPERRLQCFRALSTVLAATPDFCLFCRIKTNMKEQRGGGSGRKKKNSEENEYRFPSVSEAKNPASVSPGWIKTKNLKLKKFPWLQSYVNDPVQYVFAQKSYKGQFGFK